MTQDIHAIPRTGGKANSTTLDSLAAITVALHNIYDCGEEVADACAMEDKYYVGGMPDEAVKTKLKAKELIASVLKEFKQLRHDASCWHTLKSMKVDEGFVAGATGTLHTGLPISKMVAVAEAIKSDLLAKTEEAVNQIPGEKAI